MSDKEYKIVQSLFFINVLKLFQFLKSPPSRVLHLSLLENIEMLKIFEYKKRIDNFF